MFSKITLTASSRKAVVKRVKGIANSDYNGRAQFPCFDVSVRKSIHGDVERFRAYY